MTREELRLYLKKQPFEKIYNLIYQLLLDEIISMQILPGTKLSENSLANELGVSRSPVQTAIKQLITDGLVQKNPTGVPVVTSLDYSDQMQLLEIRRTIEGDAAYYAAKRITASELKALRTQLKRIKEAADPTSNIAPEDRFSIALHANAEFHRLIVMAAKNKYFYDSYMSIYNKIMRYRWYLNQNCNNVPTYSTNELEIHLAIYKALENRFASQAKEEVLYDINRMLHAFQFLM